MTAAIRVPFVGIGLSIALGLLFCMPVRARADAAPEYRPRGKALRQIDLINACKEGDADKVRKLLARGADPTWSIPDAVEFDGEPGPATTTAVQNGHLEVVRVLLEMRPELAQQHGYQMLTEAIRSFPIAAAATKGHVQIVKLLIERKVPVGYDGKANIDWPMRMAIRNGSVVALTLLLDAGASVNEKGAGDETPLCIAACEGRAELAELLLKRGADPSAIQIPSSSPLHKAAICNKPALAKLLLEHKAQINRVDTVGETALMKAAAFGHLEIVQLLLAAKADAKLKNSKGETALMLARSQQYPRPEHPAVIKLLEPVSR